MKHPPKLFTIAVFILGLMSNHSQAGTPAHLKNACTTVLQSADTRNGSRFVYWEENSGSPSTQAQFEFWRGHQRIWHAEAGRDCTQAVSRCYLLLPYEVDGEGGDHIEAQINYVETQTGEYLTVFSHVSEQIIYLYFKARPFHDIKLVGESFGGHEYPRKDEMVIPNTFYSVQCP